MTKRVSPTTLALDIREAISFGQILEETQPYQCRLLRRAIFQAACGVIADQLAGGDVGRILTVAEQAPPPQFPG